MANSLTDWLASRVLSLWEPFDAVVDKTQDKESLLGDLAYLRGAKVQIVRFYAPHIVQEAQEELLSEEGRGNEDARMGDEEQLDDPLWACVSDKLHFVHVKFSPPCVSRFNSTYARELISLSGSIIILRRFRPSISFVPSILESKRNKRGPFAPQDPIHPTLFLEIESFEILGSINEVVFWDTKSLQGSLLGDEYALRNKTFKGWFRQVEKIFTSEERRRERKRKRLTDGIVGGTESAEDTMPHTSADTTMSSTSMQHTSPYAPPPFQRPSSRSKIRFDSTQVKQKGHSQPSTQSPNPWGDFELSMGSGDDFGIEAAASEMLDRHSQGGRLHADRNEDDLFDPLSISSVEANTDNDIDHSMAESTSLSADQAVDTSLPSKGSEILEKGSLQQSPTFVSQSFSLPFSMPSHSPSRQAAELAKPQSNSVESSKTTDHQDEENNRRVEADVSRQQHGDISMAIHPRNGIDGDANGAGEAREDVGRAESADSTVPLDPKANLQSGNREASNETSNHKWDKYIRRPSPEVLKERERMYSTRINMIVD